MSNREDTMTKIVEIIHLVTYGHLVIDFQMKQNNLVLKEKEHFKTSMAEYM